MEKKVRFSEEKDHTKIDQAAKQAGVTLAEADEKRHYIVMEDYKLDLIAVMGIKVHQTEGLLRNFILSPTLAPADIIVFFQHALQIAEQTGVEQLYLITPQKEFTGFFEAFGFYLIDLSTITAVHSPVQQEIEKMLTSGKENGTLMCYDVNING